VKVHFKELKREEEKVQLKQRNKTTIANNKGVEALMEIKNIRT